MWPPVRISAMTACRYRAEPRQRHQQRVRTGRERRGRDAAHQRAGEFARDHLHAGRARHGRGRGAAVPEGAPGAPGHPLRAVDWPVVQHADLYCSAGSGCPVARRPGLAGPFGRAAGRRALGANPDVPKRECPRAESPLPGRRAGPR
ncbi:hypothetical protein G6F65_020511 [Rhizopus arrhizus]|nr:hypothetical protein G6F65_020511 [Rhizopus arrhizus]